MLCIQISQSFLGDCVESCLRIFPCPRAALFSLRPAGHPLGSTFSALLTSVKSAATQPEVRTRGFSHWSASCHSQCVVCPLPSGQKCHFCQMLNSFFDYILIACHCCVGKLLLLRVDYVQTLSRVSYFQVEDQIVCTFPLICWLEILVPCRMQCLNSSVISGVSLVLT